MSEENQPTAEMLDYYRDLKEKIVKLMYEFTENYAAPSSNLYPQCTKILIDVLTDCLSEAQYQARNYCPFTQKQIYHICYQIGEWYLQMKPLLEGKHNLGYMKEKLKTMIIGE